MFLGLQQLLSELRYRLSGDKADLWSSDSSVLVLCFPPETTAMSCSNGPRASPERALWSLITLPGWWRSSPTLLFHRAPKSCHYTTTVDSHTRQAICFNYVNHFILFSNISREQQAASGQNSMWNRREGPATTEALLGPGGHLSWCGGGQGASGALKPQRRYQGGSNRESPFGDKSTPQHMPQSMVRHCICASGGRAGPQQAHVLVLLPTLQLPHA